MGVTSTRNDTLRERMQASMSFRRDIEDPLDLDVSPPEPAAFMQLLIDRSKQQAEQLREFLYRH